MLYIIIIFVDLRLSNAIDNIRYKNRCRHIHGHNTCRLKYIYTHSQTVFSSSYYGWCGLEMREKRRQFSSLMHIVLHTQPILCILQRVSTNIYTAFGSNIPLGEMMAQLASWLAVREVVSSTLPSAPVAQ